MLPGNSCQKPSAGAPADYPIQPVDFTRVQLTGGFWTRWVETVTEKTIPASIQKCRETGRIDNFIFAAGVREGKFRGRFGFNDSDLFKIMEGMAYSLALKPDPLMAASLDTLVSYVAGAQEPDGYLYTAWTLQANEYNDFACCSYHPEGRWIGTAGASHELYNMGHMYEAAVAHYLVTGKRDFLEVARRSADLVYRVCITGGNDYVPGHQEIEIGLVKLFRVTGDRRFLELARHFLDIRAEASQGEYSQAHQQVTEQSRAVGHAVRANYMYSAMVDIAALTGDTAYLGATGRIWDNVVSTKLSITGGVGASHRGEAYGVEYELPNHPYNETCAAIANVYWNHRMFLLHGRSKYMDVVERTLYNGLLSGLSMDGTRFFYPNTLQHDGRTGFNRGVNGRSPWFDCSCCPSNLSRFIPSVAGYAYAVKDDRVYVNLFMNSSVSLETAHGVLRLTQETRYPWDGQVELAVQSEVPVNARLYIRYPGWARNRPVPSDLFSYADSSGFQILCEVNGKETSPRVREGFIVLSNRWKKGDRIRIIFPFQPRLVSAHPLVKEKRGLVAVEYGPLVYCAEQADNRVDVLKAQLNGAGSFAAEFRPELLDGVNILDNGSLTLVPYYSWANREMGRMNVWFRQVSGDQENDVELIR